MGSSVPPLTENNGSIAVMPNTGAPVKSATEMASEAARASIAANGTAIPPVAPPLARNAANGQFVPPTVREVPGGQPAVAPPAGQAPAAPVPPTGAAAPLPPENETPEAKQAREAAEAAAAPPADDDDALTIALPIEVEEGQEPITITADSPETAAALQELVERAVTGRESSVLLESAQAQINQINELREYASIDPVGFATDMIGNDVEKAEHLVLFLATQPTLFERLKPKLQKLVTDANELRVVNADVRAKRHEFKEQATQHIQQQRAIDSNLRDIQQTVAAMLPSDMPEAARRVAFMDCLRDLQEYADSNQLMTLPVQYVPEALRARLSALGIDPEEAASRAAVASARRGGSKPSARVAAPAAPRRPAAPPAVPSTTPRNGASFVAGAAKRKAAAMPGAGAGAPSGGNALELPRNPDGSVMSGAQAVAWHRARLAKGQRSY